MYRISCVLSKPNIISSRYHSTHTRKLLENGSVIRNNINGRRMSSATPPKRSNRLFWGYSAFAGILFGTSVTILSKYNDVFRGAIEDTIPFTRSTFNYLIPRNTELVKQGDELPSSEVEQHNEDDDDVLVVNIMDTPAASAIDFEVGNKHEHEEAATDIVNEVLVKDEHVSEELIHDAEKEIVEGVVEIIVDVEESEVGETIVDVEESELGGVVVAIVEEPAESPIVEEVISDVVEVVTAYVEGGAVESSEIIPSPSGSPQEEHLNTVLSNAYENLRIILDDTVTTKTSAAGMLHGFITQFCQALMISKEDPAYNSIWEAAAVLELNVKENVDIVKVKEAEANLQIKKVLELIQNVRNFGVNDVADKAEALIASVSESLVWGESEIEMASDMLNFLHDFQTRVEGSPQKLKKYLEDFKPDVIKLLNLQAFIDAHGLSSEDALLMLSLQRPELIYAEVHRKEVEQKKQFEAAMQQQKEDLTKEADENLMTVMQTLEANKDNEMKLKLDELTELHRNRLEQELKIQSEVNQQELEIAIAKHEAALAGKHEEEMSRKLSEQENEHYYAISKNLSYLKGIQSKITNVVDTGDQQQRTHQLSVAALALSTALNNSSANGRTRSLMPVISNVLQCNTDDDVLATVVASVPKGAADLGVIPEVSLIQRFNAVKRACMRVANMKEDGSILSYTFAYIKSLFVISRFYQRHITDDIDLETIGPYEVLEKADYYIQQGDLVQAAKLMSLLKGVPRKLCADWLSEVRLLLETKQSANLLAAYAGSFIAASE